MARRDTFTGRVVDFENPCWEPLLAFARAVVEDFMWMHTVELSDGRRLEAYKHYWTRRYLHLDHEGGSWCYVPEQRYRKLEAARSLYCVLDRAADLCP